MNHTATLRLCSLAALCAAAAAQGPDLLLTYSQPETTLSGSGGTVLRFLQPNEIAHIDWSTGPCSSLSAEKWSPRTCFQTMAGDENNDGRFWNAALFGRIDALCQMMPLSPIAGSANPRDVFWSPSAAMGNNISGGPSLRPGDVGRIVRDVFWQDGQVEYFMRREQFNQVLGLPLGTAIDVDAIAWSLNYGVFFSIDADILCNTACGPTLLRDGDLVMVPASMIAWTPDFRVNAVAPMSAVVIYNEAAIDAMVVAAGVTNRFGACVTNAIDFESVEIDWSGPTQTIVPCTGQPLPLPSFLFATETMTGASLLTTAFGGQIYTGMCSITGTSCGSGPTFGPQLGIQPTSATTGAPSYVNALMTAWTLDHVLEAQTPVMNVFPFGSPAAAMQIDYHSPYLFNFVFIEIVPPTVAPSAPAFPFSLLCFPDIYIPNLFPHGPAIGPFGTFQGVPVPPLWQGKVLFQSVGWGGSGFELSTPVSIDIQ